MQYLLRFKGNNDYAKALQCYTIRTVNVLSKLSETCEL